ncbi:type II toxin-antitoxin system RelE/ParE family toxin [Thermoanaerobacter sp. A7A]|uniref:type II toxin-antitoxin system RelE family toxin n=1 Tax=Thermoanaerobacter sp. A7A TaxID=1350366 RepID=UPI000426FAA5|nr:type II toxin-antitoxin system RelE/ParE family toxin [Thermoanaerobacter sp. A7A]
MGYKIIIDKKVLKELKKHDKKTVKRIVDAISKLPFEGDIKKLKTSKKERLYRLRVGDYRLIFEIDNVDFAIKVKAFDTRGDIYK